MQSLPRYFSVERGDELLVDSPLAPVACALPSLTMRTEMVDDPSRVVPVGTTVTARLRQSARELFLAQGYLATTTKEIAGAAGVSERTLFNCYSTKAALLRAAVIEVVTQGAGEVNATARGDFRLAMTAPSSARQVQLFADAVARIHADVAPLAAVCRQAADVDAAAAEFWEWGTAQSRRDCEEFVRALHPPAVRGRTGKLIVDETAMLTSHEVYWQLVVGFSWSHNDYRSWLRRRLKGVLLGAPT